MSSRRLVLLTTTLMLACGVTGAVAQSSPGRLEVGGGASVLRLTKSDSTTVGVSGRFSFDVARWLAADAEVTFFPSDDIVIRTRTAGADFAIGHYRRRTTGLFGVKFGRRGARTGVFGTIRPGFTRLTHQSYDCIGDDCARILMLALPPADLYRTEFAVDLGGGFELYPSARTVTRFEIGDTIIRHRSLAPPCDGCTSHNFTTRIGAGFRF